MLSNSQRLIDFFLLPDIESILKIHSSFTAIPTLEPSFYVTTRRSARLPLFIFLCKAHGHGGHRRQGSWHGNCWSSHHSCSRWSTWGTGMKHCDERYIETSSFHEENDQKSPKNLARRYVVRNARLAGTNYHMLEVLSFCGWVRA